MITSLSWTINLGFMTQGWMLRGHSCHGRVVRLCVYTLHKEQGLEPMLQPANKEKYEIFGSHFWGAVISSVFIYSLWMFFDILSLELFTGFLTACQEIKFVFLSRIGWLAQCLAFFHFYLCLCLQKLFHCVSEYFSDWKSTIIPSVTASVEGLVYITLWHSGNVIAN